MDSLNTLATPDETARQELLSFIASFPAFTPKEAGTIADLIVVRCYKKGDVLVKEGDISTACYFVLKGCLRQYRLVDGNDRTTQFYTERQMAALFTSHATHTASASYLACAEDSILVVGDVGEQSSMYERFPKLQQITRLMMEQDFGKTQDLLSTFMASSPEARYRSAMKTQPGLLQRVPQHQLASYIGVTPESLSRIRKRIVQPK